MALSEIDLSTLSSRYFQRRRIAHHTEEPKTQFSEQELTNMMLTTPDTLTPEHSVQTPVGTWSMEGGITVFDSKSKEEIDKITLPDKSIKKRLTKAAKLIFQTG